MLLGIRSVWLFLFCSAALISVLSGIVFVAYSLFRTCSGNGDCPYSPQRRKSRLILFSVLMFIHIGVLVGGAVYGCHIFNTHKTSVFHNFYTHEAVDGFAPGHIYFDETSAEKITAWRAADKQGILLASVQIMQTHGATQEEIKEMLTEKFDLTEEEAQLLLEQALKDNSL